MRTPVRRRRSGRASGAAMALIALAAAMFLLVPAAWAQTVDLPPMEDPPPLPEIPETVEPIPTLDPPPPPQPEPTRAPSASRDDADTSEEARQADRDDPLRRWRDWTPTPGTYDTSHLDRFADRMRERGWGEGRIRRQVYAPFIVMGPATWSDSWGALRLVAGPRPHKGQDVLCTYGAPVLATEAGRVTWSTNTLGGLAAYLHRPGGGFYYYAHLSARPDDLPQGARVEVGDVIGSCGATGNASVPHVHFSYVTSFGTSVDPMDRLIGWLETAERRLPNPPAPRPEPEEPAPVVSPSTDGGLAPWSDELPTSSLPATPDPSEEPEQMTPAAAAIEALGSPATVPAAALLIGVPLLGFWRRRTREPLS